MNGLENRRVDETIIKGFSNSSQLWTSVWVGFRYI